MTAYFTRCFARISAPVIITATLLGCRIGHAQDNLAIDAAAVVFTQQYVDADDSERDRLARNLVELSRSGSEGEQTAIEFVKALTRTAENASGEVQSAYYDLHTRVVRISGPRQQPQRKVQPKSRKIEPQNPQPKLSQPDLNAPEAEPLSDEAALFDRVVRAATWVITPAALGSGTLIHEHQRLVLTNYHVVGMNDVVHVQFARFEGDRVISDVQFYRNQSAIRAVVVARDQSRDLAIVQLDSLPDGVVALPIAEHSPKPGEQVYLVGNGGAVDALFAFLNGSVRAVNHQRFTYTDGQQISAVVVTTSMPTNPGDSGAAIVNRRGEIVGVNMCYATEGRLVSRGADVSEIARFLRSR